MLRMENRYNISAICIKLKLDFISWMSTVLLEELSLKLGKMHFYN